MKNLRNIKLFLLTISITSVWNIAMSTTINLQVDAGLGYADSDVNVGSTGTIYKKGAGATQLSGNNTMYSLEIQQGSIQIANASSMPSNNVAYTTNPDNICEINTTGVSVPGVSMSQPGYLLADYNTSIAGMSGSNALTVSGGFYQSTAGAVTVSGNLASGTTPVIIAAASSAVVNPATGIAGNTPAGYLKIGGASNKMSGGDLTVNGLLEITSTLAAKAIPGQTTIGNGAILSVNAGVTIPSTDAAAGSIPSLVSDVFSNAVAGVSSNTKGLKFANGSTLQLGDGARYKRAINVDSFDQ